MRIRLTPSTSIRTALSGILASAGLIAVAPAPPKIHSVTEVFHLAQVGQPNAAETAQLRKDLYLLIKQDYDKEVEKERAALKKAYAGQKVRVLRVLDVSDANGPLYLCAYNGDLSVLSIAGESRFEGELTPALKIEEDGTHITEVTRTVKEKPKTPTNKPALEVVDPEDSGVVTFFGIPLVFDDGPAMRNDAPQRKRKKVNRKPAGTREVTEKKELPKFRASVSTEELSEGPPLLSPDLLLSTVRNGKIFQVGRQENRRCQTCRGFRRITDDIRPLGRRDPDGKMPCPECKQAGTVKWDVTYLVAW